MSAIPDKRSHGAELTTRGLILGAAITLVFTAANVYLGLKVGLTFASSIPAAVISMAVLSVFPGSNIRENNIVQTVASAAGALSAIIFVLPGLVIIGCGTGFRSGPRFWSAPPAERSVCSSRFRCAGRWSRRQTFRTRKVWPPPRF
jgi:uncharacterized oligopeptide transporter (OPT) family protein